MSALTPTISHTVSRRILHSREKGGWSPRSEDTSEDTSQDKSASSERPSVRKLQKLLRHHQQFPYNHVDQVWRNLYLGDMTAAQDTALLKYLRITHVLNAAENDKDNKVNAETYKNLDIAYQGLAASNEPSFDISPLLQQGAQFIKLGATCHGKVLVFSCNGMNRAATIVLAYLMLHQRLPLEDAIKSVISQRGIKPNSGFLGQLHDLDKQLLKQRTPPKD
ncbi:dual specificity protein phosphatase 13B-like [Ascaphus truei]|uniref:dual specificity protein phosphatase 13B-like n=1 Tax=Ascaphus truei TaxID=8439 RepID=UPI003F591AAD